MADQTQSAADSEAAADKRFAPRQTVFKSAKIVFGQSVIDALVVNASATGVRLRIAAIMTVPERVTLEFSGGAVFTAVRRWARGLEIGFALEGAASLPVASAHLAGRVHQMLRDAAIDEALRLLRESRFFDDLGLQAKAEAAEAALQQLETALADRTAPSGR